MRIFPINEERELNWLYCHADFYSSIFPRLVLSIATSEGDPFGAYSWLRREITKKGIMNIFGGEITEIITPFLMRDKDKAKLMDFQKYPREYINQVNFWAKFTARILDIMVVGHN